MNFPYFLFHFVKRMSSEVQKGHINYLAHHGMIQLIIIEGLKHATPQLTWVDFIGDEDSLALEVEPKAHEAKGKEKISYAPISKGSEQIPIFPSLGNESIVPDKKEKTKRSKGKRVEVRKSPTQKNQKPIKTLSKGPYNTRRRNKLKLEDPSTSNL